VLCLLAPPPASPGSSVLVPFLQPLGSTARFFSPEVFRALFFVAPDSWYLRFKRICFFVGVSPTLRARGPSPVSPLRLFPKKFTFGHRTMAVCTKTFALLFAFRCRGNMTTRRLFFVPSFPFPPAYIAFFKFSASACPFPLSTAPKLRVCSVTQGRPMGTDVPRFFFVTVRGTPCALPFGGETLRGV